MKELELDAINELIKLYSDLYEKRLNKEIIERAKFIYNEFTPGHTLMSNIVNSAVGKLFPIGYPNADPEMEIPTKKEIKEIIKKLEKRKQELENE